MVERARDCCEYCRLSPAGQEATFHVDHVLPVARRGQTTADNLALACVGCSLHKAAREAGVDPDTGRETPLYNPRSQRWREHFRWDEVRVVGLTPTGRATVSALEMNRPTLLAIRAEEELLGRHPRDDEA